jgi:phosphoserine phosphatase
MNLTLFDLDNTLLPLDSDYEWGQFLVRTGAVDQATFTARNAVFYEQYQQGTLNPSSISNSRLARSRALLALSLMPGMPSSWPRSSCLRFAPRRCR